jgi:hypothetical protein
MRQQSDLAHARDRLLTMYQRGRRVAPLRQQPRFVSVRRKGAYGSSRAVRVHLNCRLSIASGGRLAWRLSATTRELAFA